MPADPRRRRARHLAEPPEPDRLRRFPTFRLNPARDLYRVHRSHRGPWFFVSRGEGRFDLTDEGGTCYVALDPSVAFIEVFYGLAIVPLDELAAHSISTLHVPAPIRLADCTSSRAASFGITAELHTIVGYGLTQRWAAVLHEAGFGGIRYWARHDPGKGHAVALFGPAGAHDAPIEATSSIDADLQTAITRRYGVVFLAPDI